MEDHIDWLAQSFSAFPHIFSSNTNLFAETGHHLFYMVWYTKLVLYAISWTGKAGHTWSQSLWEPQFFIAGNQHVTTNIINFSD
jgi:hypothetical protein